MNFSISWNHCFRIPVSFYSDSMSYVWGVAFSKDIGAEKTPRSNSARVVSAIYALLALIMVNTYCANLMAFLLQEPYFLPITGVRDVKVGNLNFDHKENREFSPAHWLRAMVHDNIDNQNDVISKNVRKFHHFSKPISRKL